MVSDKGIDVLIEAMAKLRSRGFEPSFTLVVGGQKPVIRGKVNQLGLGNLVTFAGQVTGEKLNRLLNAHRIMVVPSREGEGFGVVALEGIACGCVVVGSTHGGLSEAIGQCGRIFPSEIVIARTAFARASGTSRDLEGVVYSRESTLGRTSTLRGSGQILRGPEGGIGGKIRTS